LAPFVAHCRKNNLLVIVQSCQWKFKKTGIIMIKKYLILLLFSAENASSFIQQHPLKSSLLAETYKANTRLYSTPPEPLCSEGDWTAYLDESTTGLVYYFNGKTGESRWVPPSSTFPSIKLSRSKKRVAEEKQKDYQAAISTPDEETEKKGFFSSMIKDKKEKEQEEWFSFLSPADTQSMAMGDLEEEQVELTSKKPDAWLSGKRNSGSPAPSTTASDKQVAAKEEETTAAPVKRKGFLDKLVAKTRERAATETVTQVPAVEEQEEFVSPTVITPEVGGFVLAAPQKMIWGGEDAIFTKKRTFGVFDGVSGAEKLGGLPLYSKMLAQICDERVAADQILSIQDMQKLLADGIEICNQKATGATTALLASIGPDGFLRVLNIGDAGVVVVRGDKVVARSKEISHFYECPYQFSQISPDRPRDGTKLNCELVKGDLLVAGSDGIFDNLSDDVLVEVVRSASSKSASVMAKTIGEKARKVSQNPRAETPYALAAKKQRNPDYADGLGGKVDDISCVVVRYE
jgi:protein phosphatase PTC7